MIHCPLRFATDAIQAAWLAVSEGRKPDSAVRTLLRHEKRHEARKPNLDRCPKDAVHSASDGSTMADDLEQNILDNAAGPKRARGDSSEMEQHALPDQIAADRYVQSKKATQQRKGSRDRPAQARAAGDRLMLGFLRNILAAGKPQPRGRQLAHVPLHVRGRYDAATTTDENRRHWANADHLSANAANIPGRSPHAAQPLALRGLPTTATPAGSSRPSPTTASAPARGCRCSREDADANRTDRA